jgi:hypothetical protein
VLTDLPARFAMCPAPIPDSRRRGGHLLPSEESASFLLWAWPRLLGWSRAVNWLFSPVVGNKTYPGDLWGVDSHGDLLMVETKLSRSRTAQDPFSDFEAYCSIPANARLWRAETLRRRWSYLFRQEERFLRTWARGLDAHDRRKATCPGVLPYSEHRDAVWRYQTVFRTRIVPRFRSGRYRRAVDRALRIRSARGDPKPVFVGLIATIEPHPVRLSAQGSRAFWALRRAVGPERVLLRILRATGCSKDRVRIECRTQVLGGGHGGDAC